MLDTYSHLPVPLLFLIPSILIWVLSLIKINLHDWSFSLHTPHSTIGVVIGGVLFICSVSSFFYFADNPPDLKGSWTYEVSDSFDAKSHSGEVVIEQDGHVLKVIGTRKRTRIKEGNGIKEIAVDIPWNSDWAWIDNERRFVFHYIINLPTGKAEGIAIIPITEENPNRIWGNYFLMPPFENKISDVHATYGTARFSRVGNGK